ncbi:transcription activator [Perilla frutescens var. hirtella]|nr:transcription activator [Perilla frutescens var. hirtella]
MSARCGSRASEAEAPSSAGGRARPRKTIRVWVHDFHHLRTVRVFLRNTFADELEVGSALGAWSRCLYIFQSEWCEARGMGVFHSLLTKCMNVQVPKYLYEGISAKSSIKRVELGPQEFYCLSRLRFNKAGEPSASSDMHRDIFASKPFMKGHDIDVAFETYSDLHRGSGSLVLKLVVLHIVFGLLLNRDQLSKSIELEYLHLIDDYDTFNNFPWGKVAYQFLVKWTHTARSNITRLKNSSSRPSTDIYGFSLVLQLFAWKEKSLVGRYASLDEVGDGGEKRNKSAVAVVFGCEECVNSYGLPFCPDLGDFLRVIIYIGISEVERMGGSNKVDKLALDAINDSAEVHLQSLEPWIQLLLDLMAFREQSLRLILDLSSTVIILLPHQNSLILHAFMDLFCSFVRVNLFSEKIPGKMMLQTYNLLYAMARNDRDCDFYHRLIQFVDSYDPPLKGLHEDLNFVSPRIGEVLEAVGPIIFLSTDTRKLRNEGFLSPFHPRYPDILTNSAHPMRAQDLANVTSYREWVLFGYLVCPDELLKVTSIDIALVVLKENLVLTLFRDEYILLHEDYQLYVLPRILESKRMAKSGRTKQKEVDLEYSVAKQMVFSALAFAQSEVLWYFQHVGIGSSKSKTTRVVHVETDPNDPTIGFLLDGMDHLYCLVRKYISG